MSRQIPTNIQVIKREPSLFEKLGGKLLDAGTNYLSGGLSGMLGLNPGSALGGGGGDSGMSVADSGQGVWNQSKLGDQLLQDQSKNKLTTDFSMPSFNAGSQAAQGQGGASTQQGGYGSSAEAPGDPYGATELVDSTTPELEGILAKLEQDPGNAELVRMLRSNPQMAHSFLQQARGGK